jgi:hypothetical protein
VVALEVRALEVQGQLAVQAVVVVHFQVALVLVPLIKVMQVMQA